MKEGLKNAFMIGAMVVSWSIYYAVSKVMVSVTGSPYLAGFLLRSAALLFLTAQLLLDRNFARLFHQGKAVLILIVIGVFGFLLDLFANLGYAHGALSTGTALLKTDVLMVNLVTVILYHKKLYLSDWIGTLVMLFGVLLVLGVDFGGMRLNPTDLFFILSAMCVTANAFIIKTAQERFHEDADMISYYNNFVVLVLFGSSAAFAGDLRLPATDSINGFWWLVLLGGLAQTGIYFFYYRNLKHYEVWVVKLYLLLMPVVSCFIGVLFLGEELTLKKSLGILVVLLGAAVILLRSRLHREESLPDDQLRHHHHHHHDHRVKIRH
ncbi:MAG: DMT family transporter [Oscillospiraceae bacterium]|nr:DMT family transporter [Oscillospiraceae bacterium]